MVAEVNHDPPKTLLTLDKNGVVVVMERKPVLVGLKNGRVTALSIDTSNEERLSFIENGCDSVILMPENSDVPDFKAEYKIKFVKVA